MKIALCTVGSTGDTQPFMALGKRLIEAGHEVIAISHPFHKHRFESQGIPYASCGPVVDQEDLNKMLDRMLRRISPLKQLELLMMEAFFAEGDKYFREAKEALKGCDLAVCHMVDFLGQEAAVQLGIPRIGVVLAPAGIPSDFAAPPLLPEIEAFYPTYWKMLGKAMERLDRKATGYLEQFGGPSIKVERFHSLAPELNLIASSPILTPTYPDLPSHFEVTGHWHLPEPDYKPSRELEAFLERHHRPIIVSFGSMGGTKGPRITKTVLEAAKSTGQAVLVQSGYAGLFGNEASDNVFFVDYVPHGWLFPKGSMVIHHGGAGTSTAACRAGVPSVVVAFIADQPYFGRHLNRLGVAPKALWWRRMNVRRLGKRIQQVLEHPEMGIRAEELGPHFLAERGLEKALAAIEDFGERQGLPQAKPSRNASPLNSMMQ